MTTERPKEITGHAIELHAKELPSSGAHTCRPVEQGLSEGHRCTLPGSWVHASDQAAGRVRPHIADDLDQGLDSCMKHDLLSINQIQRHEAMLGGLVQGRRKSEGSSGRFGLRQDIF